MVCSSTRRTVVGVGLGLFVGWGAIFGDQLRYEISCNQERYLSGETILVNSVVSNLGAAPIRVQAPRAAAFVVEFELQRVGEQALRSIAGKIHGAGMPIWSAEVLELQPGGSVARQSDLGRQFNDFVLETGSYVLTATYRPGGYQTEPYVNASNPCEFEVLRSPEKTRVEWGKLSQATTAGIDEREQRIEGFLVEYPSSIFRVRALHELHALYNSLGAWEEMVDTIRRLRAEAISTEQADLLRFEEALVLERLGRNSEAQKVLEEVQLPAAQALRGRVLPK